MHLPRTSGWPGTGALAIAAAAFPAVFGQISPEEMQRLEARLPAAAARDVSFERDIRPLFDQSCFQCHGPERPKSRFRLDNREEALKGGANGVDLVPGQSARSPLLFYAARLVEDMEMPPPGKAEALSPEQLGLLRAWIDQGANWGGATNTPPKLLFSVTPSFQWFTVKGNEQKFREHTGIKDGANGGVQSIFFQEQVGARKLTFEGRTLVNPGDYKFKLQLEQRDLGYVQLGFEQYREYYSDTGGYASGLTPPQFSLERDLHLDVGRAWANFVLTLPDKPRILLGYEYQYRDGSKSLLQWGDAGTINPENDIFGTDARKVFPSAKDIEERVHIVKFDVTHEINGLGLENNFRAEFYDNNNAREGTAFYNSATGSQEKYSVTREHHDHFQASDSFHLEKQVLDWLFLSGGYYFSRLNGEYGFTTQTLSPAGIFSVSDPFWFGDSIVLEQNTHVLNANLQLGPWNGLTIYGGAQSEWMSQRGFGRVRLDEGIPGAIDPVPASVDSNLDRFGVEEHVGARYTKIPFTVLFAEGRWSQESIGQYESQFGGTHEFLRDTDAASHLAEGRVGFTVSPWTRLSLTTQYKHRNKDAVYDHLRDEQFGVKNEGYSAFITSRDTETDEVSVKLTLRPANWLKTSLTYQKVATDYTTGADSFILPEIIIPGLPPFPAQVIAPGGSLFAGNYDADVYGIHFTLVPWQRLSLASTFSYRSSRTTTSHSGTDAVAAYDGDMFSTLSSATFALNAKTDITGGYTYSWADYGQDNAAAGLPVGLAYDWHVVSAALTRRFRHNISATLQYRFYYYDEFRTTGFNNYTAHGVLAAMTIPL